MDVLTIGDVGVLGGVIHIGDEAMFEVAAVELSARGGRVVGVSSAPEESTERYGLGAVGRLGFTGLERAVARERASPSAPRRPVRPSWRRVTRSRSARRAGRCLRRAHRRRWQPRLTLAGSRVRADHPRGDGPRAGLPVVVSGQTFGPDLDVEDAERICVMTREAAWTGVREHDSAALARSWGHVFTPGSTTPPSSPAARRRRPSRMFW